MFANCFFKQRILPCCDVMDYFACISKDGKWLMFLSFFVFNISETNYVIKNLETEIISAWYPFNCDNSELPSFSIKNLWKKIQNSDNYVHVISSKTIFYIHSCCYSSTLRSWILTAFWLLKTCTFACSDPFLDPSPKFVCLLHHRGAGGGFDRGVCFLTLVTLGS